MQSGVIPAHEKYAGSHREAFRLNNKNNCEAVSEAGYEKKGSLFNGAILEDDADIG